MGLPNPRSIETGNDTQLRIRCSEDTKKAIKQMFADMDPEATMEENLLELYRYYRENPKRIG